ncbi:hypothetical protein CJU89_4142 [Yarrowia sp. B02]|nr:hypothetical protein CJU89_4142 [Yarrowia sp. B02]
MTQSQEDLAVTQRVLVNDALYRRIAKTVTAMAQLKEADPELKQQLASDLRAYRLMLTKLKLQKAMNDQEVEKLNEQAGEASKETEKLQQTTAELEAQLAEARQIQQQKKQYTDLTSELLRPYKVEVTLTRVKESSEVKEEEKNDNKEDDEEEEALPTPAVTSRSDTPQTEDSPRRHGDEDEAEEDGDNEDEDEDVGMKDDEADNSMDIDDEDVTVPEFETYSEVINAHLFRTRAEAAQLNSELQQDIADLKVTNRQYEATWQQRRHRFLEIIASLHTFQGDIQTEKAEQERRAAEREEEEKKRQEEEQDADDDDGDNE